MLHRNTCVAQTFLQLILVGSISNYAVCIYKGMDILVVCHHARSIYFDVDIKANQGFEAAFLVPHPLPNQSGLSTGTGKVVSCDSDTRRPFRRTD